MKPSTDYTCNCNYDWHVIHAGRFTMMVPMQLVMSNIKDITMNVTFMPTEEEKKLLVIPGKKINFHLTTIIKEDL